MGLSAPIFILKQQAKSLSRKERIPLHQALNRIANREGFSTWSLLSAKAASDKPTATLLAQLHPQPNQEGTTIALTEPSRGELGSVNQSEIPKETNNAAANKLHKKEMDYVLPP